MDALFGSLIEDALDRASARSPELGAGPLSALTAACAGALATMSSRYAGRDDAAVQPLLDAGQRLRRLADDDGPAFIPLLEAWQLPHDTPDREQRVAEAARIACGVPLDVCRTGLQIAEAGADLVAQGKRDLRGDSAAAVLLADAAVQAAAILVRLNAGRDRATDMVDEARTLAQRSRRLADQVTEQLW